MQSIIKEEFSAHILTAQDTMNAITKQIEAASKFCIQSLNNNCLLYTSDAADE